MKNKTLNEIIKSIKSKGYIVNISPNTAIYEPYKSQIDGKLFKKQIAYSSMKRDKDFLAECLVKMK